MSNDPACIFCEPNTDEPLHICDNCKTIKGPKKRKDFFDHSLETLQQKAKRLKNTVRDLKDLKDLKVICQFLIQFVSKIQFSFAPTINFIDEYIKDEIAEGYIKGQERFRSLVPIRSDDDGNCLFNSIIILGRLDQKSVSELRVRSLLEVISNYDTYVKHYSGLESVADNLLQYCSETHMGKDSQLWDVVGLCGTLKCRIKLMYFKEPPLHPLQNTTYRPCKNAQNVTNEITLLWTDVLSEEQRRASNEKITGIHFVPLVRYSIKYSECSIYTAFIYL